jgi:CheY-like chemotaxis protein
MEAVGRLAGGIAHDFNNLLTVIVGYSSVVRHKLAVGEPLRDKVALIQDAADRAATTARRLLMFTRKHAAQPQVLDLNTIIRALEPMLARYLGEDMEVRTQLEPALWRVKADPGQIEQVVLNLAVNSREAMPEGGTLRIGTTNVPAEASGSGLDSGSFVLLEVHHSGHGLQEETFLGAKDHGSVAPLGLSIVYEIVEQNGGRIQVESRAGQGASFRIYLPQITEPAATAPSHEASPLALRGNETILLIEDEAGVREYIAQALAGLGYQVLRAAGGAEALQLAESHTEPIHLLLTDVVMPKMSGRELARRLSTSRPNVKIIYMSGYAEDSAVQREMLSGGAGYLQKPFTEERLLRKIRELLGPGSSAGAIRKE